MTEPKVVCYCCCCFHSSDLEAASVDVHLTALQPVCNSIRHEGIYHNGHEVESGESKWQPLNGNRQMCKNCEKTEGSETEPKKARKQAKNCKNGRKQTKTGGKVRKR